MSNRDIAAYDSLVVARVRVVVRRRGEAKAPHARSACNERQGKVTSKCAATGEVHDPRATEGHASIIVDGPMRGCHVKGEDASNDAFEIAFGGPIGVD